MTCLPAPGSPRRALARAGLVVGLLSAALAYLALSSGAVSASEGPAPSREAPPQGAEAAGVAVTARLITDAERPDAPAALGRRSTLEITVTAPRALELFEPLRPALGAFRVAERVPGTRRVEGDQATEVYRFEVVPLRLGYVRIPPIEIPFRGDGPETAGTVATPPLRVYVRGHLANEADPRLGAAPAPVPVITTNWLLIWLLSVGGAVVVAALLTLLVLKALEQRFRALEPAPPPRPADAVARERLAELDATGDDVLDGAERLAETIDILREYLGARYRCEALEMTTPELLAALRDADLKTVELREVEALMGHADLVKFARIVPPPAEARALGPRVLEIVEATWEPPEVDEDELAIVKRDAATRLQRLYAGAIDGAIALGLAGVLFGLLWAMGELQLGWTAILLVGVLLAFRDSFGRSAGKVLLGLAVVARTERQPAASPRQLASRNLPLLLWPLTLPLELLLLRRHPLGLRLGDIMAGTEIVQGGAP